MSEQYTNIRLILDKLLRHPLLQDINLETAVDYCIDFMRIVGVPSMFTEKTAILEVENYRALLPCDYYSIIQVREKCGNTFRYSTDSFHMSEAKNLYNGINELTYKIQGNIIYTSIKEGEIEIAYEAIEVDSEGYPLIPDNSSFTRALTAYIKKEWFTILFDLGKLHGNILGQTLKDYAWAVGDCESEFKRLSIDKAESLFNSWRTLLIRDTQHSTGFINNGTKERIKEH
jgi:hypothetical protein